MIQLFARVKDLIATEPPILSYQGYFCDPDEKILLLHDMDCVKAFARDIGENGMTYSIQISPGGSIRDGNCRYYCARYLQWEYVPVVIYDSEKGFYPKPKVK